MTAEWDTCNMRLAPGYLYRLRGIFAREPPIFYFDSYYSKYPVNTTPAESCVLDIVGIDFNCVSEIKCSDKRNRFRLSPEATVWSSDGMLVMEDALPEQSILRAHIADMLEDKGTEIAFIVGQNPSLATKILPLHIPGVLPRLHFESAIAPGTKVTFYHWRVHRICNGHDCAVYHYV